MELRPSATAGTGLWVSYGAAGQLFIVIFRSAPVHDTCGHSDGHNNGHAEPVRPVREEASQREPERVVHGMVGAVDNEISDAAHVLAAYHTHIALLPPVLTPAVFHAPVGSAIVRVAVAHDEHGVIEVLATGRIVVDALTVVQEGEAVCLNANSEWPILDGFEHSLLVALAHAHVPTHRDGLPRAGLGAVQAVELAARWGLHAHEGLVLVVVVGDDGVLLGVGERLCGCAAEAPELEGIVA
mmetsp:Transcript_13091/g.39492  ORF Transcript_13091/g.39492 Transcript_13091/m.39492 type:complete len:241 (+) Transcript_13091:257-979(+)